MSESSESRFILARRRVETIWNEELSVEQRVLLLDKVMRKVTRKRVGAVEHWLWTATSSQVTMQATKFTAVIVAWTMHYNSYPSLSKILKCICSEKTCIAPWCRVAITVVSDAGEMPTVLDQDEWTHAAWLLERQSEQQPYEPCTALAPALGPHRIWTGVVQNTYGRLTWRGKHVYAHRLAWLIANRPNTIPPDHVVRHRCHNPLCIAPEHLETGTRIENARDCIRDGTSQHGERHHNASTTSVVAAAVRESRGDGTMQERAVRFDVKHALVNYIDNGQGWIAPGVAILMPIGKRKRTSTTPSEPFTAEYFQRRLCAIEARCTKVPLSGHEQDAQQAHWLWNNYKNNGGYGQFNFGGKLYPVHRAALESSLGRSLSKTEQARHLCDNGNMRACCNPLHLAVGTALDNAADKEAHGKVKRGAEHPRSKLSVQQRAEIYQRRVVEGESLKSLAAAYRVTSGCIGYIVRMQQKIVATNAA